MHTLTRAALTAIVVGATSCSGGGPPVATTAAPSAPVSAAEEIGTPMLGPGDLYNACERIWCLVHEANYALDHYLSGHDGWILHEDGHGDVYVARGRTGGPAFPRARPSVLNLCGRHVHPWMLGRRASPIRRTGYNAALGYSRAHFNSYGTRLEPCCVNGLGWSFVHAASPREFRFHDTAIYREITGAGWQSPVTLRRPS